MAENTYLQGDSQDIETDNYGLVQTQKPENDQDNGGWCILKCFRRLIRCFCRTICWLFCYCCCCRCYQGIVQIFIPVQDPTKKPTKLSSDISGMCKEMSYQCQFCYDVVLLHEELPLVVMCQTVSRSEPDIDLALTGIKWKNPFVVLLLNYGIESSLPKFSTASKLANKEKYQHVVFIDVAYDKDKGLYPCEMNSNARSQLKTFLIKV